MWALKTCLLSTLHIILSVISFSQGSSMHWLSIYRYGSNFKL